MDNEQLKTQFLNQMLKLTLEAHRAIHTPELHITQDESGWTASATVRSEAVKRSVWSEDLGVNAKRLGCRSQTLAPHVFWLSLT